jgi:hypothetical protein
MTSACLNPPGLFFRLDRAMGRPNNKERDNNKTGREGVRAAVTERERGEATEPEPSAAALDRWLNEKLRVLYGPVLSEPIPDDLARLIELHRCGRGDC